MLPEPLCENRPLAADLLQVQAETGGTTLQRVVAVASDGGGNFLVEVTGVSTATDVTLTLRVLDLGALTRTPYFTATEDC